MRFRLGQGVGRSRLPFITRGSTVLSSSVSPRQAWVAVEQGAGSTLTANFASVPAEGDILFCGVEDGILGTPPDPLPTLTITDTIGDSNQSVWTVVSDSISGMNGGRIRAWWRQVGTNPSGTGITATVSISIAALAVHIGNAKTNGSGNWAFDGTPTFATGSGVPAPGAITVAFANAWVVGFACADPNLGAAPEYTLQTSTFSWHRTKAEDRFTTVAGSYNPNWTGNATWLAIGAAFSIQPTNYSLICDAGSYAYTGQDAALRRGIRLVCDAGSYTYAGQDAALTRGIRLVCDAGSYSYSGQDANLTRGYSLICDVGSYSYSGQDADLTRGYSIAADAGAYSYTGQDADLIHTVVQTIIYYGDGKKRKKHRNRTKELFDAIEQTINELVYGIPIEQTTTAVAAKARNIEVSLKQLTETAVGYADLSARVAKIRIEVAAYEARLIDEDEDEFMMMH